MATDSSAPPWRQLFAPVDIGSLVFFRVCFGLILLWETWRYIDYGWIKTLWIDPTYYFTQRGFRDDR